MHLQNTKKPTIELTQIILSKKSIHRKGNSNGKNMKRCSGLGKVKKIQIRTTYYFYSSDNVYFLKIDNSGDDNTEK